MSGAPTDQSLSGQVTKLLCLLDGETRRRLGLLLLAMLAVGVMETISIGMFFPLFQAIVDPQSAARFARLLDSEGRFLGADLHGTVPWIVGAIVLLFVVKNAAQLYIVHRTNRFVYQRQAALLQRLFAIYLGRDYAEHLRLNGAVAMRNLTISAVAVFSTGLLPAMQLAMEGFMTLAILGLLLFAEPAVTLAIAFALGLTGYVAHRLMGRRLTGWGAVVNDLGAGIFQWITEALGSIKSVKVGGREPFFARIFARITDRKSRADANLATFVTLPRLVIETAVVAILATVVLVLVLDDAPAANVVPLLGLYGIATMRLMPAANRMLSHAAQIKVGVAAVEAVWAEMKAVERQAHRTAAPEAPVAIGDGIELLHVGYTFAGAARPALDDVNLQIRTGESVALVGPSGAGKSTLVDIIIGLLAPTRGSIRVGGERRDRLPVGWQGKVGYVPQSVFLVDDSLRRNIAFGITDSAVDHARLERAIELSNLRPVIETLEQGLDTLLGENGRRLSGGQRQRVGIARALYDRPELLVLDEATSALDLDSEKTIIDAIARLKHEVTTIIISHHVSTVGNCDRIVMLDDGRIVDEGPFEALERRNADFRRFSRLSAGPA